ncbi:MAG: SDR family oxidoreductase [Verrucomicrobia bacterium]|nr:SDR family oxidoreductase [Verrucomicrobiota bacterium]
MNKTAVVTGAGSGVGQAISLALAQEGWRVVLVGRRKASLLKTVKLSGKRSRNLIVCPCDVGNAAAVDKTARLVLKKFGKVEVLVNAAGINVPRRALKELSLTDYRAMLATNLDGAFYCIRAFLPSMRRQQSGTIINIVSDSAKQANVKAGAGYVASKFGLAGLTQSLNAEERVNGIRACAIFPGDIDTPLLNRRPVPPTPEARQKMLLSEDVAACALLAINLPRRGVVEEILIRPL